MLRYALTREGGLLTCGTTGAGWHPSKKVKSKKWKQWWAKKVVRFFMKKLGWHPQLPPRVTPTLVTPLPVFAFTHIIVRCVMLCSTARSGAGIKYFTGDVVRPADWSKRRAATDDAVARPRRRPWQRRCASPGDAVRLPRRGKVGAGGGRSPPADDGTGRWR